ncbi:MAG: hypothetical protein B7Y54_11815 [Polaromonas sp. 35-63-240]|nr:MAG: hypothetical protein B7Y54_11815 [Polaromonas sp. 35-63-240]
MRAFMQPPAHASARRRLHASTCIHRASHRAASHHAPHWQAATAVTRARQFCQARFHDAPDERFSRLHSEARRTHSKGAAMRLMRIRLSGVKKL